MAVADFKYGVVFSDVEVYGRLIGVLHFLDAESRSIDIVVDVGQVSLSGSLSDAAELVINGTVTQADPALVGTNVRSRDAAQVSANCRDDQHLGRTGV